MEQGHEEKVPAQESARGGARPFGWTRAQRGEKARQQRESAQGRAGQSRKKTIAVRRNAQQAEPWTPEEAVNAVISLICVRYGALAIGRGAGGIRYRASH
jgi:hypothetical protein